MQKKILCIGNNSQSTDDLVCDLARQHHSKNHGLIVQEDFDPLDHGYYHTTLVDLSFGAIAQLAQRFDEVILLDQPAEQWTHSKLLLTSYKVAKHIESLGVPTEYRHNNNVKKYISFDEFLIDNKSFCIMPWIEKLEADGNLVLCPRSTRPITTVAELKDWRSDPNYNMVRGKMLKGELLPDHCSVCYDYENKNIESYRQFDTKEWIARLNITSLEDLDQITHPYFYEPKTSNKCNLMCRGCQPSRSHLIAKEFKLHDISHKNRSDYRYANFDIVDIATLNKNSRVYLAGGEPTIMKEVFAFMRKCIDAGKTDFELTFGTNAVTLSKTFLRLLENFHNVNFSVSLDGFGKINDYWRHGSDWDQIIKNAHYLKDLGHNISINTVPGIYNVTNLHLLFEFLDREFPHSSIYLQINYNDFQSAYNHPLSDLVVDSMSKCKQTNVYLADGKSCKTGIDSLYDYYSQGPQCDLALLKKFFEFNDKLDQIRNIRLADYIPELDRCRKFVQS